MKLTRLRCTNCGASFENIDLEKDQHIFKCTRLGCGAVFFVDQGVKFADIQQAEAEKIQHYREEMARALSPFDRELAARYASNILEILPDDYRAKAVFSLSNASEEDNRPLYNLLTAENEATPEEFAEVFPVLLKRSDYHALTLLQQAVPRYVTDEKQRAQLLAQVAEQTEFLKRKITDYADVPRDVFVCHKSDDLDIVMRVVRALEADGNKCWISERNMPPDTRNYWEKIDHAINRCSIFLVCCSDSAMYSDAVMKELSYADSAPVQRLELKLDDTPHTVLFNHFFDGLTWVKLGQDFDASMAELKEWVYRLKHERRQAAAVHTQPPQQEDRADQELLDQLRRQEAQRQLKKEKELLAGSRREQEEAQARRREEELEKKRLEAEQRRKAEAERKRREQEEESKRKQAEERRRREKEELERAAAAHRQRRRSYWLFTLLAIALYALRRAVFSAPGSVGAPLFFTMMAHAMYLVMALYDFRVLILHSAPPRRFVSFLLLVPLAFALPPVFSGLLGLEPAPADRYAVILELIALACAMLSGMVARRGTKGGK